MTREQAKRWLKEIEWWGNGGNLWDYDFPKKRWIKWNIEDIYFNSNHPATYIIEDEHFEARKAWALGEPIQYRRKISDGEWKTMQPGNDEPGWHDDYEYRVKRSEWYRNIPEQGILCRVWDTGRMGDRFYIITEYVGNSRTPFCSNLGVCWEHAVPATPEEIEQYLLKRGQNED